MTSTKTVIAVVTIVPATKSNNFHSHATAGLIVVISHRLARRTIGDFGDAIELIITIARGVGTFLFIHDVANLVILKFCGRPE